MDKKRNALNEMRVMVILEEVQFVTCRFSGVQCRRRFTDFTWNMRKECESNKNERVNDREKGEKRVKTQRRAEGNNGQRERDIFGVLACGAVCECSSSCRCVWQRNNQCHARKIQENEKHTELTSQRMSLLKREK